LKYSKGPPAEMTGSHAPWQTFSLSPGEARDAGERRELLKRLGMLNGPSHPITDRAYEGNETRNSP